MPRSRQHWDISFTFMPIGGVFFNLTFLRWYNIQVFYSSFTCEMWIPNCEVRLHNLQDKGKFLVKNLHETKEVQREL